MNDETNVKPMRVIVESPKNPWIAILLSLVIAGLGQFYIGKGWTGWSGLVYISIWSILFLGGFVLGLFTAGIGFVFVLPLIFILDVISSCHAFSQARKYNKNPMG